MGRTSNSSKTKGVSTIREESFGDNNLPKFVGVPEGQRGVTIFSLLPENQRQSTTHRVINSYYPVDGDISDEPIEIVRIYDTDGNPVSVAINAIDQNNRVQKINTYAWTDGEARGASIPLALAPALKRNVFVHNHPRAGALSFDDAKTAASMNFGSIEARLNRNSFWNNMVDLHQRKVYIGQTVKQLKKEYDDKYSLSILNNVSDFLNNDLSKYYQTANSNSRMSVSETNTLPYIRTYLKPKTKSWPKIKQTHDEYYVAAMNITQRLYLNSNLRSESANFLVGHAAMKHLADTYNLNYGITEA
jgi:hypothetical protein